jgi:hypothetical protein
MEKNEIPQGAREVPQGTREVLRKTYFMKSEKSPQG